MNKLITAALIAATSWGVAYAAQTPAAETEERGFPLAIILSLVAVFMGSGVAIFAASQKKKRDGEQ